MFYNFGRMDLSGKGNKPEIVQSDLKRGKLMEKLTVMELETLKSLRNECFISEAIFNSMNDDIWATGWQDCALDQVIRDTQKSAKQIRGVFSSLVKKGFIAIDDELIAVHIEKIEHLHLKTI